MEMPKPLIAKVASVDRFNIRASHPNIKIVTPTGTRNAQNHMGRPSTNRAFSGIFPPVVEARHECHKGSRNDVVAEFSVTLVLRAAHCQARHDEGGQHLRVHCDESEAGGDGLRDARIIVHEDSAIQSVADSAEAEPRRFLTKTFFHNYSSWLWKIRVRIHVRRYSLRFCISACTRPRV